MNLKADDTNTVKVCMQKKLLTESLRLIFDSWHVCTNFNALIYMWLGVKN